MNSKLLFLIGCIPVRIGIVLLFRFIPEKYLPIFGWMALVIAIGFMIAYNRRMKGIETNNKPIWWNPIRPIHACLYFLAFLYAVQKKSYSWIPLAIDVAIGFLVFMIQYKNKKLYNK